VSGNQTINGDLIVTGNIKCGNKLTLGNGNFQWNLETNLWENGLSFYNTAVGPLRGHGRTLLNTDGNIWSAGSGEQWLSTIKGTADTANGGVNELKRVKRISSYQDQGGGDQYRTVSFGITFATTPTVTITVERNDGRYQWLVTLVWVNNSQFCYRFWAINAGYPPNSFPASDAHRIHFTATGT
jgi:hypothetical protein